ncbi:2-isopropylmalate synthase [Candidatus Geothermarchaeota archaeon ex4572_27]|nr:MAG: 2-isopropylmalate synthase [Candidatus Geothermarchaeota archaeon ex4572_27]
MVMGRNGPEWFHDIFPFTLPPRIPADSAQGTRRASPAIAITDTTLRDGQQGWRPFTVEESLRIYEVLVEMGGGGAILSTELFLYTRRDREVARKIAEYGHDYPKPVAWIRASMEDLKLVLEAGLDEAVVLTSISDYHILLKLGLDRRRAFEKYLSVVEEALKQGITVRCSLEDATRASLERNIIPFVRRLVGLSERYGLPVKVKVADTLGVGLPFPDIPPPRGVPRLIRAIVDEAGLRGEWIEFHGHNDLGLAVANHLAAWLYGAAMSNCTLFGIGERAGNCPLEVMLIHYIGIRGEDGGANPRAIAKAARLMRSLGFRIPEFHPLVGENAFRLRVLGIPYTVAITPYSGKAAVALWINAHASVAGLDLRVAKDDPRVDAVYREVLRVFDEEGRREPLADEEMMEIVARHFPELAEKLGRAEAVEPRWGDGG